MSRSEKKPSSGRILLRIPPGLHAGLKLAAAAAGLSMNDYCTRKLAGPSGDLGGVSDAVLRAATIFGPNLLGVVAFGSWARDELRIDSDIDLLVVLDDSVLIRRDLYRVWDLEPIEWEGRPVEPHFVHLPSPESTAAGLWAEVALDGLVLFSRDPALPARLSRVRRDIADGRIVRRVVHGQPYWVEAA